MCLLGSSIVYCKRIYLNKFVNNCEKISIHTIHYTTPDLREKIRN
jgi:hypothetical protein